MNTLIVILICAVTVLALIMGGILAVHVTNMKRGFVTASAAIRKMEVERLLFRGKAREAKAKAMQWTREEPRNPAAYLIQAKAAFQLGELVEAKRLLEEMVDFAPESEFSARHYLNRIRESLEKSKPRAVE
ncbi:MAG TPA: hypothetical protein VGH80_01125 [Xanthomonadaceae bacterium]